MSAALPTFEELTEEFADLQDWDERYEYLIDLGRQLPEMPEELLTPAHSVSGCMSSVWMVLDPVSNAAGDSMVHIRADSDSLIVKGLIAVLLAIFSDRTPKEIIGQDERQIFADLGLDQNLSPQRRNGLFAMVQRIKQRAVELASRT